MLQQATDLKVAEALLGLRRGAVCKERHRSRIERDLATHEHHHASKGLSLAIGPDV